MRDKKSVEQTERHHFVVYTTNYGNTKALRAYYVFVMLHLWYHPFFVFLFVSVPPLHGFGPHFQPILFLPGSSSASIFVIYALLCICDLCFCLDCLCSVILYTGGVLMLLPRTSAFSTKGDLYSYWLIVRDWLMLSCVCLFFLFFSGNIDFRTVYFPLQHYSVQA